MVLSRLIKSIHLCNNLQFLKFFWQCSIKDLWHTLFFFFKFQVTSCILPLSYSSKKYSIQSDKAIVMGFLTVTFPHILDSVRFSWNKTNFKPFNFVVFLQHIYMWLMCLRKSLVCLRQNPSIKIFMPTINSMKAGLCLAYSMMYKHQ